MSFYDPAASGAGFGIALTPTTPLLTRFHRTLMDRRATPAWADFDPSAYEPEVLEYARRQWAERAVAEYQSTAQFAQLLHRMTKIGAPLEMIGAATRLAQDECRHAELCAQFADRLGGRDDYVVQSGLSMFDEQEDDLLAVFMTLLMVCCFGETISVPMLRALYAVATDPIAERVTEIIAADEEYHARFGWEAVGFLEPGLSAAARDHVREMLPAFMGHFERVCHGSPERAAALAGKTIEFETHDGPNLGTLGADDYAALFYFAMTDEILPRLGALGIDAEACWVERPVSGSTS